MTTEDDFQHAIDRRLDDWHTRLVFADWLDDQGDPRAAGYRAIATQQRCPYHGHDRGRSTWWWRRLAFANQVNDPNDIPPDWFALLPSGEGSAEFWPVVGEKSVGRSRRECEDALALAFAELPMPRRAELLVPPAVKKA